MRFWPELREQHPELTPTETKAINKLFDVGPNGFANAISTKKYVNLCRGVTRHGLPRTHGAVRDGGVGTDGGGSGDAI